MSRAEQLPDAEDAVTEHAREHLRATDHATLARCRRRLRALLPELPDTLEELRARMEAIRGREIDLQITDPGTLKLPSGLWSQLRATGDRPARDLIWVDRRTSPFARTVVACHEFGHMICGHDPQPTREAVADPKPLTELAPRLSLDPAQISAVIGRCGEPYEPGSPEWQREREAELTGRILAQHILDPDRARSRGLLRALKGRR
ncbi:hypothetical protein Psed_6758 (plasmid) [Pseudonocardia dioxanivorans CB1190]|uniref:IrrE N-terminal-like domain-containing protein n=1 Tax=Pseudonocardia dioxanivorans (strain ATCC 55486 / DSM 44775 / JCM 13855 / CB1190) TaxID=675635 RepID=F2L6W7_PSEUX|nr:ImmA/IrrE family metallo-endopeptidase [Pseudonocardia dioxanivorans]AEA28839.1 hypothetical protein Psed_6758 [Pseudonocardia dioxanivorans CB1190]GJF01469.1 hypothetical protein PSD17_04330 [Pseudonocardia sp. D17]